MEAKSNVDGMTALLIAARESRVECMRLLIEHGADVEVITAVFLIEA